MTNRQILIEKTVGTVNRLRPTADQMDRVVEEVLDELAYNEFPSVTVNDRLVQEIKRNDRLGWWY